MIHLAIHLLGYNCPIGISAIGLSLFQSGERQGYSG